MIPSILSCFMKEWGFVIPAEAAAYYFCPLINGVDDGFGSIA